MELELTLSLQALTMKALRVAIREDELTREHGDTRRSRVSVQPEIIMVN